MKEPFAGIIDGCRSEGESQLTDIRVPGSSHKETGARGDSGQIHNLMKGSVSNTSKPQRRGIPLQCAQTGKLPNSAGSQK
ncbi:hypothetical protein KUCAC02_018277 [Chaenocephalus aceratus]|uniref:Uncharacterized protein n=1 Tax=Chaenocephalus aceratus TaxID=36190 RepID=A0ACB9W8V9_CHAAC|nr:hypothetical protein KUCAC02_018277 [Chaenocephalus aceratus]